MKKTYTYYQDAGHGWLKVTRAECARLDILDKISAYSYQYGTKWIYLEEDGDFSVFHHAKFERDEFYKTKPICSEISKIRSFPAFSPVVYSIGDRFTFDGETYTVQEVKPSGAQYLVKSDAGKTWIFNSNTMNKGVKL